MARARAGSVGSMRSSGSPVPEKMSAAIRANRLQIARVARETRSSIRSISGASTESVATGTHASIGAPSVRRSVLPCAM